MPATRKPKPSQIGHVRTPKLDGHSAAKKAANTKRGKQRKPSHQAGKKLPTHGGSPGGGNTADPVGIVYATERAGTALEPHDYWTGSEAKLGILHEDFQVFALRKGFQRADITDLVEQLDWDDSKPVMTGSLQFRDLPDMPKDFRLQSGDQIMVKAREGGNVFKEWWRMRIIDPQADYAAGTRTFTLASDLHRMIDSQGEFKYVASASDYPKGWLAHEVIADICEQYNIDCVVPEMTARIRKLGPTVCSPMDVVVYCLKKEQQLTGKRYSTFFEHGTLVIRPRVRSPKMLELGDLLITASYSASTQQNFATALYMRASSESDVTYDSNGHKKATKTGVRVYVEANDQIARHGLITRMGYTLADSAKELENLGSRHLALLATPARTFSAQHPGIIGLRRNDAIHVDVKTDADLFDQVLFVKEIRFSLSAGAFNMDLVLQFEDPWVTTTTAAQDGVYDTIDQVQAERGRKTSGKGTKGKAKKKKPKRNTHRAAKPHGTPSRTAKRGAPKIGGVSTPVKRKK